MIWGGADVIIIERKCTLNVMLWDHPETIPHLGPRKIVFQEISPWCQKGWGPLLWRIHFQLSSFPQSPGGQLELLSLGTNWYQMENCLATKPLVGWGQPSILSDFQFTALLEIWKDNCICSGSNMLVLLFSCLEIKFPSIMSIFSVDLLPSSPFLWCVSLLRSPSGLCLHLSKS